MDTNKQNVNIDEDLLKMESGSLHRVIGALVTSVLTQEGVPAHLDRVHRKGKSAAFQIILKGSARIEEESKPNDHSECWQCSKRVASLSGSLIEAGQADMLRLLDALAYSVPHRHRELPFTFGRLDDILPLPSKENKTDPDPYHHYPPRMFQIEPGKDFEPDNNIYHFNFDTFQAVPGSHLSGMRFWDFNDKNSPTHTIATTPYASISLMEHFDVTLSEPRNLMIPKEESVNDTKFSNDNTAHSEILSDIENDHPCESVWDLPLQKISVNLDLWTEACKLPYSEKRNLISSSARQMALWKKSYANKLDKLNVISETEFILHLKYLTIGIQSKSFYFDRLVQKFVMRKNLCLEGLHVASLKCYLENVLHLGTCFWKLYNMASPPSSSNNVKAGFVYQSLCDNLRNYMVWYRLEIDRIFGEELLSYGNPNAAVPTLLNILRDLEPLKKQLGCITKIYITGRIDNETKMFKGGYLMAHLYEEIVNITDTNISNIVFATLKDACDIYFKFIQRFLFEGEIEDYFDEFFIRKDPNYVNSSNKKYWDKGFVIKNNEVVPQFLKGIADDILLCGKSVRLLRLCVPDDPFCILLSSDVPQIKTCFSFAELNEQEKYYNLYKTRCLYVCGDPVNFQSLQIQKEIEKKRFKDLIQLKQAEAIEKITEEHKRLHLTLSISKKQQLEEQQRALLESEVEKRRQRERNLLEDQMYMEYNLAMDKVDQLKLNSQKKKVQDYYQEIGEEIEQRRKKAEWKMKRLKLDDQRTQILIAEKMTLSIEKFEAENALKEDQKENSPIIVIETKSPNQDPIESSIEKMETSMSSIEISPEVPVKHIVSEGNSSDDLNINECENTSNILNQLNTKDNTEITHDDIINKNSLMASKEFKSLDFPTSPSDIVNSNAVFPSSISEQNIYNNYQNRRQEALKNKLKFLNQEMGTADIDSNRNIMLENKTKSLESKHFDSKTNPEVDYNKNEQSQFRTEASMEASRNKTRILGHEFGIDVESYPKKITRPKDNLSLDLKKCFNRQLIDDCKVGSSENIYSKDDVDLTLETPNIEIQNMCIPTANTLSPRSAQDNTNLNVTSDGFPFPSFIEDFDSEEEIDEVDKPEDEQPMQNNKPNMWNFDSDYLNMENFKPFGIDSTADQDKIDFNIFKRSFEIEKRSSPYSDIRQIIEVASKSPLTDVFESFANVKDHDALLKRISDEDISTIKTCLHQSVVIPLVCQMELVNNAIIKYFLVNCDLYEHLRSLCDYFFLMNGEFAKTICQCLFEKLSSTESPKDLLNFATLHSILNKSFGSSTGYNKYAENLSFIVNNMPLSFHHSSPDVLECLTLSYAVAWPINIILSPEAMDRYGRVFQFLIKLRRISWALDQNSEALKMSLKEEFLVSRDLLRSPQYHAIQIYRHIMSSLIRSLQTYIQSTCLQASWAEFENDLTSVWTLDDLYSVHVVYIKKVLFRCMLNKRSTKVMKLLNDIFTVILRFHHSLNARCWHIAEEDLHYTHPLFGQMQELFTTFNKLAKHFHKTIACLIDCGYQPHLVELMALIDYNGYYSTQKKLSNRIVTVNNSAQIL